MTTSAKAQNISTEICQSGGSGGGSEKLGLEPQSHSKDKSTHIHAFCCHIAFWMLFDNSLLHAAKAKEHAIVDSNVSLILPVGEVILWKPLPTFLCEAKDAGWSLTAGFHQASESSI